MPKVVPSQVVRYIDGAFKWVAEGGGDAVKLDYSYVGRVSATVALAERVPEQLLTLQEEDFADFVAQVAVLRSRIAMWEQHGASGPPWRASPVQRIRDLLAKCPDQNPSPTAHELTFVTDQDLRTDLRMDISAIDRGLVEGDWKSVTVLAGSVIEALLLWKLRTLNPSDVAAAETTALNRTSKALFHKWDLHAFIEVAAICPTTSPCIHEDTATLARLTKDFRNLIHPERVQRVAQKCDRGTALAATAALEMVVRDLGP